MIKLLYGGDDMSAEKKDLNLGFGELWTDVSVIKKQGYYTSVKDYHKHAFFELVLILSGNVKILLSDHFENTKENRLVLTRPGVPHYISCESDTLYSRLYLMFSEDFISNRLPEWKKLSLVFGEMGEVIPLSAAQTEFIADSILKIDKETDLFRKRLLIYILLSHISEYYVNKTTGKSSSAPSFIFDAISYIENNYHTKLTAEKIAKQLHIGRTTLMTEFKHHIGDTIGNYITTCRLRNAVRMIKEGKKLEYTAVCCGFSDSSGLIRSFKKTYGKTPKEYLREIN